MTPPTSGSTGSLPMGGMMQMMMQLFGGQQPGSQLAPGATSLYAPTDSTTSTNVTPGTGAGTATNPFSSFTGSNIVQNSNGSVSLAPNASAAPASTGTSSTTGNMANMFSGFESMIQPYINELQGISQNANQANSQTQSSLNTNLANTAQTAAPSTNMNQTQADQDILQAVTGAVNGVAAGGGSYNSYWNDIQSQLQAAGFTPDMITAMGTRLNSGMALAGNMQDKGGGNTSTFISNDSSALDSELGTWYQQQQQPSASPITGALPNNATQGPISQTSGPGAVGPAATAGSGAIPSNPFSTTSSTIGAPTNLRYAGLVQ